MHGGWSHGWAGALDTGGLCSVPHQNQSTYRGWENYLRRSMTATAKLKPTLTCSTGRPMTHDTNVWVYCTMVKKGFYPKLCSTPAKAGQGSWVAMHIPGQGHIVVIHPPLFALPAVEDGGNFRIPCTLTCNFPPICPWWALACLPEG